MAYSGLLVVRLWKPLKSPEKTLNSIIGVTDLLSAEYPNREEVFRNTLHGDQSACSHNTSIQDFFFSKTSRVKYSFSLGGHHLHT